MQLVGIFPEPYRSSRFAYCTVLSRHGSDGKEKTRARSRQRVRYLELAGVGDRQTAESWCTRPSAISWWPRSSWRTDSRTSLQAPRSRRNLHPATQSVCLVCLFIHQSTSRNRNTIWQEKYNLNRIKRSCGLNGKHRTVPLAYSQNVTQHSDNRNRTETERFLSL